MVGSGVRVCHKRGRPVQILYHSGMVHKVLRHQLQQIDQQIINSNAVLRRYGKGQRKRRFVRISSHKSL